MTQTFIDTSKFQIIITVIVSVCIIGIFSAIYNIMCYRQIASSGNSSEQYARSALKMSVIVLIVFTIAVITTITVLTMNLNELKTIDQQMIKPGVATAESLAEILE